MKTFLEAKEKFEKAALEPYQMEAWAFTYGQWLLDTVDNLLTQNTDLKRELSAVMISGPAPFDGYKRDISD